MLNHYPEPHDENAAYIAQQCTVPGTTDAASFLYTGNLIANPKLLSPIFQDTGKLLLWLRANGWRKTEAGFDAPYRKNP